MRITDPKNFGRVAVVMGGESAEREVSLNSGANVLKALQDRGVNAFAVDGLSALLALLSQNKVDRVFNILHGGVGESGVLQGALDAHKIPYTGSGVLGAALTLDKVRTKQVWQSLGIPTPAYAVVANAEQAHAALDQIGLPAIFKPVHEGSSVGISRVYQQGDVAAALELASRYDGELLVEQLIEGDELTVGILGEMALPSIHIIPAVNYYDYHAKYIADDTQYICPGLQGEAETQILDLCLRAFIASGASGWGRVDVMRDKQGNNWLLEVNTAPGMTSHSLVPKAAKAIGIGFEDLVWRILEASVGAEHE